MTTPASEPAAAPALPAWRPLLAIVRYTLRTALPRRRWYGVLALAAASVLFGLLSTLDSGLATEAFASTATVAHFGLLLPVTSLIVGDGVLGAEVRSGTFAFTWLTPVPRWQIVVGRWIGGSIVAAAATAVAFAAAAVAGGAPEHVVPITVAGAFAASAYVAVFILIGVVARRTAVWSLAFVFLVERLLGAALSGIAQLSPAWLGRNAYLDLAEGTGIDPREGMPAGSGALARLVIVTAVVLVLASRRLRSISLTGSSD